MPEIDEAPAPLSIESMMGDMERAAATPEKPPTPAPETPTPEAKAAPTPEPDVKPVATPKVEPKAEAPKPSDKPPEKPASAPKAEPKEDAGSLRRRLQEVSTSESTLKKEIETIRKENQELANRRYITPEVEKEMADNRQYIATMKQQIEEVAYERSDTFKDKFKVPFDNLLQNTVGFVKQLTITNDEGATRAATEQDFWKVAGAPVSERAQIARTLFGDNALVILSRIDKLEDIKVQSDTDLKNHREQWDGKQKQQAEEQQNNHRTFQERASEARKELQEKFPDYFGENPDDPKANEALKAGYEFLEHANRPMTVIERADFTEVIAARAAWFPRGIHENRSLKAENASLKAELAKLRGSDPGAEPKLDARGEKVVKDEGEINIESMSERIQRAATV